MQVTLSWTKTYDVLKFDLVTKQMIVKCLEPKHMMYWNPTLVNKEKAIKTWTKTYDVLKFILHF